MRTIKDSLKKNFLKLKYKRKCKKLNISDWMLDTLIENYDNNEAKKAFELIGKSNNFSAYKDNILNYFQGGEPVYMLSNMLLGTITKKFSNYSLDFIPLKDVDFNNFKEEDYTEILEILKQNLYDYLMQHNQEKNRFLINEDGNYDYTMDLDREKCNCIFDTVIDGLDEGNSVGISDCYKVVRDYIVSIIGIYGTKNIKDNMDFILYDLTQQSKKPLIERKKDYLDKKDLTPNQITNINNIGLLEKKIKTMNSADAKHLLKRISIIKNDPVTNILELNDIYLEYEILLRKDILSHLYIPTEKVTFIEDFREMKPQLLHMFIRKTEQFRESLNTQIVEEIIKQRKNSNGSRELTKEEMNEYNKRKMAIDFMIDQTQVNYFFDGSHFMHSDQLGLNYYYSDTSNQIATSIYSETYFLKNFVPWRMGVGFNNKNLLPESIAISSSKYLTTNKGLNNLEHSRENEFSLMSCTYPELLENDGKSEIVLFRRNMECDTRASYLFLTVDSSNLEKYERYVNEAKEKTQGNDMKVVIFDLYKIRKSYNTYLEMKEHIFEDVEDIDYRKGKLK